MGEAACGGRSHSSGLAHGVVTAVTAVCGQRLSRGGVGRSGDTGGPPRYKGSAQGRVQAARVLPSADSTIPRLARHSRATLQLTILVYPPIPPSHVTTRSGVMRGFGTVDCCGTAVKAVAIAATVAVIAAVVAGGHAAPAPAAAAGALAAGMAGAPPPPSSSPLSRTLPSPPSLISQPQLPLPSPSPSPLPLPLPTPSFPLPPDRPRWCDALLAEPAAAGDKGCHPTTEDNCGARAPPRFYGQFGQDAWAYVNHFAALRRPGVFLDVATNDAIHLSNTYVFEVRSDVKCGGGGEE